MMHGNSNIKYKTINPLIVVIWMWNLVSYIHGRIHLRNVWEQSDEGGVWIEERVTIDWRKVRNEELRYFFFVCLFVLFCFWRNSPQWARVSSFTRFPDHTQRRTTVGRAPLDEWSAHRTDLYLTTHNTHNKHPCPQRDSNPQPQQASGFVISTPPKILSGRHKQGGRDMRACGTNRETRNAYKDYLKDLDVDGRIILKLISEKHYGRA